MPEDKNIAIGADATSSVLDEIDAESSVPFEDLIRQQLALIATRLDSISDEVNSLRQEIAEQFVQLNRQVRDVDAVVSNAEERVRDLDCKLDEFIKEQIRLKREWREFQHRETAQ
jgi:chromosome segregation ATPase